MMLKKSGERRHHPCLVSDPGEKASGFSPSMMLAVGVLKLFFIELRKFPSVPDLLRLFKIRNRHWILSDAFSPSVDIM